MAERFAAGRWEVSPGRALTGPERNFLEQRFRRAKMREEAQEAVNLLELPGVPYGNMVSAVPGEMR